MRRAAAIPTQLVTYPPVSAEVGEVAPDFSLPTVVDGEIKQLSLKDYRGKWVVLFWYPKDVRNRRCRPCAAQRRRSHRRR